MKKGSRKVQFELRETHILPDAAGGWAMRVVLEGHLDGLSGVQEALEEAVAQAPSMIVEPPAGPETPERPAREATTKPLNTTTSLSDSSTGPLDSGEVGNSPDDLPFDPAGAPDSRAKGYKKRIATTQGKET